MANEYMNSRVYGAGLQIPVKTRKAATDKSSVNSMNKSKPAPAAAQYKEPNTGKTMNGPATVIKGVYTQPSGGRKI